MFWVAIEIVFEKRLRMAKNCRKILIIGLPRTGTTTLCALFLEMGFRVAHTAYTKRAFELADVVADTPVYCDYPQLDVLFPESKFIYLDRELESWSQSTSAFLTRLRGRIGTPAKGMNPILDRCIRSVFGPLDEKTILDREALKQSYKEHQDQVMRYFDHRPKDLLFLNISDRQCLNKLSNFLKTDNNKIAYVPRLNRNGKLFEWDNVLHELKVSSHARGSDGRRYFDFPIDH